ncbi:metallophosphoesterase [Mucilaginibacter corticis]|nr:metallophosphoesterase [Mucilaginibacter corticis]
MLTGLLTFAQKVWTVDGPYVRYEDQKAVAITIEKDDNLTLAKSELILPGEQMVVTPEGHPEWAFKVSLKEKIEIPYGEYPAAGKTLFVSDIEGEFKVFRELLLKSKVIDQEYNWIYGANNLVIAGDLFDRGKDVVPELWLLYKLEDEAKAKGGSVHVLLGNHDIMNLDGDHRYTDGKYFKNAWLMGTDATGLFGKDTELGRWLLSKNIVEKIGDVLVMHAGLSPEVARLNLSLEQLNHKARPYYDVKINQIPADFKVLFDKSSPFWYRAYFRETKISMAGLDSTLQQYACKYIVVGHTIVKWNVASYYEGKVIGIDVDTHKGHSASVLYENGKWHRDNQKLLRYKPKNDQIKEKDIL